MSRFFLRLLLVFFALLVVLSIVLAIVIPINTRRSFPQVEGEVHLAGLDGKVDIYRDAHGIPHIYASTPHDLFFAQGYVHAQDRFWQMDFWRHQGAGRLSELLGSATLEIDAFLRTLGWERVARQELAEIDADSLAVLQAYAEGVNAYLAEHQGSALSLEYMFLKIVNRSYRPQPWQPLHTLTWAKAMAWDLGGNMDAEIDRAMLLKTLSSEQVAQLTPPYPSDHPLIVPEFSLSSASNLEESPYVALLRSLSPAWDEAGRKFAALAGLRGNDFADVGSNSWVISGARTASGLPILANDPHLGAQMPSIWYAVGLHCQPKTAQCPYEVTGVSFAGAPGVIIGHNDRIAWGFTNVGPDVMDLYIEKVNPDNPNQYEFEGKWADMQVLTETIQVAGGEPYDLTIRLTHHGPLITQVYQLDKLAEEAGIEVPEHYAVALRWTALEPNYIFRSIWKMDIAQNWDEFRSAAREFAVPAQNLVYADVEGNIGYQMPGNIPIRVPEHSGLLPVPGWMGSYEWQGYIPFEELPYVLNPPKGYIVTANNAVVGDEYPYAISREWDYGFRAQRIADMIEQASTPFTVEAVQQMQYDHLNLSAKTMIETLLQIPFEEARLVKARNLLANWDGQFEMNSAAAALYAAFWKHLLLNTFQDDLPDFYVIDGGDVWMEIMRRLIQQPQDAWWDDRQTPAREERDAILRQAFLAAVDELEKTLGKDPIRWSWGDLHTLTLRNEVMSNFPLIEKLFNRGPFPTAGGSSLVNNTVWRADRSYEVIGLPSMRMIVDLSDLSNSWLIHTSGQSGHAYHPHYVDMTDPWRLGEYFPMLWEAEQVQQSAEGHLRLLP